MDTRRFVRCVLLSAVCTLCGCVTLRPGGSPALVDDCFDHSAADRSCAIQQYYDPHRYTFHQTCWRPIEYVACWSGPEIADEDVEQDPSSSEAEFMYELPKIEILEEQPELDNIEEQPEIENIEELPRMEYFEEQPTIVNFEELRFMEYLEEQPVIDNPEELPQMDYLEEQPEIENLDELFQLEYYLEELPEIENLDELPQIKYFDLALIIHFGKP